MHAENVHRLYRNTTIKLHSHEISRLHHSLEWNILVTLVYSTPDCGVTYTYPTSSSINLCQTGQRYHEQTNTKTSSVLTTTNSAAEALDFSPLMPQLTLMNVTSVLHDTCPSDIQSILGLHCFNDGCACQTFIVNCSTSP